MTRLIDADALLPMMRYATIDSEIGVFPIKIGFEEIVRVIDDAPTVDAVPVVRCKDCKYRKPKKTTNLNSHCVWYNRAVMADDYCSKAERKEE